MDEAGKNFQPVREVLRTSKNKDVMRYRVMPYNQDDIKVSTPASTESRKVYNYRELANRFEPCIAH